MMQNNNIFPDRSTFPADTPGPISWWLNPFTHEHDPFITLQVDEYGLLPTAVEFTLAPGMQFIYTQPVRHTGDYAIMPEALAIQAVNQFCDELNAALDAVEEPATVNGKGLAVGLLLAAAFWTAVWAIWRGLV